MHFFIALVILLILIALPVKTLGKMALVLVIGFFMFWGSAELWYGNLHQNETKNDWSAYMNCPAGQHLIHDVRVGAKEMYVCQ